MESGDAGRYSRSFGLSASLSIAGFLESGKPTASPQRSPEKQPLPRMVINPGGRETY